MKEGVLAMVLWDIAGTRTLFLHSIMRAENTHFKAAVGSDLIPHHKHQFRSLVHFSNFNHCVCVCVYVCVLAL